MITRKRSWTISGLKELTRKYRKICRQTPWQRVCCRHQMTSYVKRWQPWKSLPRTRHDELKTVEKRAKTDWKVRKRDSLTFLRAWLVRHRCYGEEKLRNFNKIDEKLTQPAAVDWLTDTMATRLWRNIHVTFDVLKEISKHFIVRNDMCMMC